jgi:hypothetical protein
MIDLQLTLTVVRRSCQPIEHGDVFSFSLVTVIFIVRLACQVISYLETQLSLFWSDIALSLSLCLCVNI